MLFFYFNKRTEKIACVIHDFSNNLVKRFIEQVMDYQDTSNRPKGWNLYSRHGHTLLHLAKNRDMRMTDLAAAVGITDRQVRSLLKPMEASGVVRVERIGRNNRYELNSEFCFTHPVESKILLGDWLDWHNSLEE